MAPWSSFSAKRSTTVLILRLHVDVLPNLSSNNFMFQRFKDMSSCLLLLYWPRCTVVQAHRKHFRSWEHGTVDWNSARQTSSKRTRLSLKPCRSTKLSRAHYCGRWASVCYAHGFVRFISCSGQVSARIRAALSDQNWSASSSVNANGRVEPPSDWVQTRRLCVKSQVKEKKGFGFQSPSPTGPFARWASM